MDFQSRAQEETLLRQQGAGKGTAQPTRRVPANVNGGEILKHATQGSPTNGGSGIERPSRYVSVASQRGLDMSGTQEKIARVSFSLTGRVSGASILIGIALALFIFRR